jgi:hypothetical protein
VVFGENFATNGTNQHERIEEGSADYTD